MIAQDPREDLRLPEIRGRLSGRHLFGLRAKGGGRGHPGQQIHETRTAQAVRAPRHHDNPAAREGGGLGGGHPLDRLVEVLIERVTAIGGDRDGGGHRRDPAPGSGKGRSRGVRRPPIPGECRDDAPALAQDDVEDKGQPRHVGGSPHLLVDRVPR